jgi:hypothetical protein
VLAVFAGGGQVGPDCQKRSGAVFGTPAAADLLLELDHPDVALGLVVGEVHAEVGGETQHVVAVKLQAAQQRGRGPELGSAAFAGRWWWRVEPLTFSDQRVVTLPERVELTCG